MPDRSALPGSIRHIVEQYLAEWLCTPFHWLQEIDVQTELAARIRMLLELHGKHLLCARHSHYLGTHEFSRVTCEPYVKLSEANSYAHPDIVVWDDCEQPDATLNDGRWPMIWACEIKYTSGTPDDSDRERLNAILREHLALSACWIRMLLADTVGQDGVTWSQEGDLWICEAEKNSGGASNKMNADYCR